MYPSILSTEKNKELEHLRKNSSNIINWKEMGWGGDLGMPWRKGAKSQYLKSFTNESVGEL